MIPVPSGVKVWLATGHTDMRKGFPGLSLMVQETLKRDPMCGHLFVFRGRGGGLIKVTWHDGHHFLNAHILGTTRKFGFAELRVIIPQCYAIATGNRNRSA